jgi:RecA/RadA recombinase
MYRYPRKGCALVDKKLVQSFRIETHNHFVINDGGGSGTAAIFINQVAHRHGMGFDVALFVFDTPSREVGL